MMGSCRGTMCNCNPSWVFTILHYFKKVLPSIGGLWCAVRDNTNTMGYGVAGDK